MVQAEENFLVPNGTFIIEWIAFLIMLGILAKYVIPHLLAAMNKRQEIIRRQFEESEAAKRQLEQMQADYVKTLESARAEAAKMKEDARSEGKRIIEEMRAKAQEEAAKISAANQRQMEVDRQRAVAELRADIGRLAVELSSRIVGEALDDEARRSGVVDRFIVELEGQAAASPAGEPAGQR